MWLIVPVRPMMKMKKNNNVIDCTIMFHAKNEIELSDWSDKVRTMMKNKLDNVVKDRTVMVYVKIGTELSWLIWLGIMKPNKTTTWLIIQVWSP